MAFSPYNKSCFLQYVLGFFEKSIGCGLFISVPDGTFASASYVPPFYKKKAESRVTLRAKSTCFSC
jgi:hypothetical protein